MKRRLVVGLIVAIVGWSVGCAASTIVVVDVIDAAFPPFSFIDENGEAAGFDVEVIRWIADEMGFSVQIVPVDWDAIVPTLLIGQIDVIASGMTITAARREQVAFTDPYWTIDLAVVVRQTNDEAGEPSPELTLFEAVADGRRIGVQRGTTSQEWLQTNVAANGIDVELVLYDSFLLALEDLLIGRIDSAVMDEPTARAGTTDRPLTVVGTIQTGEIYGYAVRKDDTELLSLLNEGLRRLQASEVWTTLIATWLVGN